MEVEAAEPGLAKAHCIGQHGLEHRLQLARRAGDNSQHLRGRGLLLQRLGELLFQVGVGCAKTVDVSSRLRLRTKTGNAFSALRPFASQGHLVDTVTGPLEPRIEAVNPSRTARRTPRRFIRSLRRRARAACLEFGGQAPWRS